MTPRVDIEEAVIAQLKDIAEIEKQCIADGWSEKAFLETFENKYSIILSAVSAGRSYRLFKWYRCSRRGGASKYSSHGGVSRNGRGRSADRRISAYSF